MECIVGILENTPGLPKKIINIVATQLPSW